MYYKLVCKRCDFNWIQEDIYEQKSTSCPRCQKRYDTEKVQVSAFSNEKDELINGDGWSFSGDEAEHPINVVQEVTPAVRGELVKVLQIRSNLEKEVAQETIRSFERSKVLEQEDVEIKFVRDE